MSPADDAPPADPHAAADAFRHDVLTPLTVVRGRAFLLARAVRRSPTLADDERERLLAGLAVIDAAVDELAALADRFGADEANRGEGVARRPRRPGHPSPRRAVD